MMNKYRIEQMHQYQCSSYCLTLSNHCQHLCFLQGGKAELNMSFISVRSLPLPLL